jgi:methylated-DNA-[protein]-cysteine S-methyltransferase
MPTTSLEVLLRDRIKTPIGPALLILDDQGRLWAFDWEDHEGRMLALLARFYGPGLTLNAHRAPAAIRDPIESYFSGTIRALDSVACSLPGTPFQRSVWSALRKIPGGRTRSYRELAAAIGRPNAVRAVGAANSANPISVVIPCHRLIGSDGNLTGYGGGIDRKRWLLHHEGVDVDDLSSP